MEIKTDFNIGEYAFILFNNKIYEVKIESISIQIESNSLFAEQECIRYSIDSNPAGSQYTKRFDNSELFKTEEELAEHLINQK